MLIICECIFEETLGFFAMSKNFEAFPVCRAHPSDLDK